MSINNLAYRESGTRSPYVGPETQDRLPGTPKRDPEPGTFTWDLIPGTLDPTGATLALYLV